MHVNIPAFTVNHYLHRMRGEDKPSTLVTGTVATQHGDIEITIGVTWELVSDKDGEEFNFCHTFTVSLPFSSPEWLKESIRAYFGSNPEKRDLEQDDRLTCWPAKKYLGRTTWLMTNFGGTKPKRREAQLKLLIASHLQNCLGDL